MHTGGPHAVRVVHLTPFASAYPGSFVGALTSLRSAVEQRGWSFEAVFRTGAETRSWYEEMSDGGVSMRVAPVMPRIARMRWIRALLAESDRPTILHCHFLYWDLDAVVASRLSPTPVSVLWHRHGRSDDNLVAKARQSVRFGLGGRMIDAHICVGPAVYQEVLRRHSPQDRTHLLPNAIDLEHFVPATREERATARTRLELAPDLDVLVAFVWDWQRKGGDVLLEALRRLRVDGRAAVLLLVGDNPAIREAASRADSDGAARPLPAQGDVRSLYAAADVFVSASDREGMPYALLESIASGTPVVASDIPEHRVLVDGMPACSLAAREPWAMSEAIASELEQEPAARAGRLAASRAHLEANAGIQAWARKVCELYANVLAKRGLIPAEFSQGHS